MTTMANPYGDSLNVQEFIKHHRPQFQASGIPRRFWETLHGKLMQNIFDAGLDFSLIQVEYEDSDEVGWKVVVSNPEGIPDDLNDSIYLIDHAWTYSQSNARVMLKSHDGLKERMARLMDLDPTSPEDELTEKIMEKQWLYNQTYSFNTRDLNDDNDEIVWYIMDELGSRIQHNDEPSVRVAPFMHLNTGTVYSVFWPLRTLLSMAEVTRDYMPHIPIDMELERLAHLLPWSECDFTDIEDVQKEPNEDYFTLSRLKDVNLADYPAPSLLEKKPLLVWTDSYIPKEALDGKLFLLTEDRESADIVFPMRHITDFMDLVQRGQYINQFPYETVVVVKDLLAIISRRAASHGESHPRWLPVTYNLNTELQEFVSHFQQKRDRGENNCWIAKPWNLARGRGHMITDNLNCLVRLPEAGPFIACKYLENPVLFHRPEIGDVKMDFRYLVILKSVKPLKLSCDKRFYLRFCNKHFSMSNFDAYDQHFTVHNYKDPKNLLNLNCEDFIPMWNDQHPGFPWAEIEIEIMQCLLELFQAATSKDMPLGIGHSPLSRAQYGVDMMLKWSTDSNGSPIMVPQILEANFSSDNARAFRNYPSFHQDMLEMMYINAQPGDVGPAPGPYELVIC